MTLHNDLKLKGFGEQNHNFSVYTDATVNDQLFYGKPVYAGHSATYRVSALPAGTYFFRCDIHQTMTGVLVVK